MHLLIRNAGKEETVLAVYMVTDSVDRCQVGFVPQLLIKHMGKYNGFLAQVTDVYSAANDSNYRKQKVYKTMVLQKQSVMKQKKQKEHYSMQQHQQKL